MGLLARLEQDVVDQMDLVGVFRLNSVAETEVSEPFTHEHLFKKRVRDCVCLEGALELPRLLTLANCKTVDVLNHGFSLGRRLCHVGQAVPDSAVTSRRVK